MFSIAMLIIMIVLCDDVHGDAVRYLTALYDHMLLFVVPYWLTEEDNRILKGFFIKTT